MQLAGLNSVMISRYIVHVQHVSRYIQVQVLYSAASVTATSATELDPISQAALAELVALSGCI